jgi:tetratricopeptide (TPR) repeat protein
MDAQNVTDTQMRRFRRKPNFRTGRDPQRFVIPRDFWKKLGRWALKQITPARVLIALIAVPVVVYIWREVTREVLIIDPFTVPKRYEEAGLTPDVMANRVGDAMRQIEYDTQTNMKKDAFALERDEASIPAIEIPGTKFDLKAMIDVTRGIFGIYPKRISGDIVLPVGPTGADSAQTQARVTIYVSQGRNRSPKIGITCPAEDVDGLVQQTAELVLRQINPYVLAAHAEEHQEYEKTVDIVQTILRNTSQDHRHQAAAMILLGTTLDDQHKYDEAIEKYQKVTEVDPKYADAYYYLGYVLDEQKKYDEAITKYQKVIEIDPKNAYAYTGWGNVLYDQRKYNEAIAKYQKAVEIDPKFANAYDNWGAALRSVGKDAEAEEKFKKAEELSKPK